MHRARGEHAHSHQCSHLIKVIQTACTHVCDHIEPANSSLPLPTPVDADALESGSERSWQWPIATHGCLLTTSGQQTCSIRLTLECGNDSHPGGPCIMHNSVSWMWSNAEDIGRLVILVVTQSDEYGCGSMVGCAHPLRLVRAWSVEVRG